MAAIAQILLLDLVFSIDSIITAVGMTDHMPIMVIAVIVAVGLMLLAADPLARFINNNPTMVMLALGFLLMIGSDADRRRLRRARAQGLHLRRHGLLGPGRGAEHAGAPRAGKTPSPAQAPALRPYLILFRTASLRLASSNSYAAHERAIRLADPEDMIITF